MKSIPWYLPGLLAGALILAGCKPTAPGATATNATADAAPVAEAATLSPELMPTAEPL